MNTSKQKLLDLFNTELADDTGQRHWKFKFIKFVETNQSIKGVKE